MTVFNLKDWQLINDFLVEVGGILRLKDYCLKVLELIKPLINYDSANFFIHPGDDKIRRAKKELKEPFTVNIEPKVINDYINYFQFIDDMKDRTFNLPYPVRSTDIMDYREWSKTEYFNDFLRPNHYYYTCGTDLHYRKHLLGTISFFRDIHSPDFSLKELFLLEMLVPHLANHLYKLMVIEEKLKIESLEQSCLIEINERKYSFTPRESEVFELVIKGFNNNEIADELYISVNTVKKHLYKLFLKTGSRNRTELVATLLRD